MNDTPSPVHEASAPRPVRYTVFAILHFIVGGLTLPWIGVQLLVLLATDRAGVHGSAVPIIALLTVLTAAGALFQLAAGVGLLRQARWGLQCTWIYAVLSIGAGVLLWLGGGRTLFATLWLVYPMAVVVVFARPLSDTAPPPAES